ncbi:hypothetical protein EVAR_76229_1 [Eumeta japonica]|uniref:Uncharacterized protein n=1 Tax=Eumeta variegata TaxID=151549 RepID=A0A4C1UNV7_EUMVA|nr:hypothetical protein EVAR_76229_1 [Eumeta japonica]
MVCARVSCSLITYRLHKERQQHGKFDVGAADGAGAGAETESDDSEMVHLTMGNLYNFALSANFIFERDRGAPGPCACAERVKHLGRADVSAALHNARRADARRATYREHRPSARALTTPPFRVDAPNGVLKGVRGGSHAMD